MTTMLLGLGLAVNVHARKRCMSGRRRNASTGDETSTSHGQLELVLHGNGPRAVLGLEDGDWQRLLASNYGSIHRGGLTMSFLIGSLRLSICFGMHVENHLRYLQSVK